MVRRQRTAALFRWSAGKDAAYNAWVKSLGPYKLNQHPVYRFDGRNTIQGHVTSDAPYITDEGYLRCWVDDTSKNPKGHCEWCVRHESLRLKTYLKFGTGYSWRFNMRIGTPERIEQYYNTHVTWLQSWGPITTRPPAMAMQTYRGRWRVQCYGDTVDNSRYLEAPIDTEWHEWKIAYTPHPRDGTLVVSMDGAIVYSFSGPTAYTDSRGAGQQRFGCYTPKTPEQMWIEYRDIEFS